MSCFSVHLDFPGGKRVDARIGPFTLQTDQSLSRGGEASAPEPFDLFLASLATCAGVYALSFCQTREVSTAGLRMAMNCEFDEQQKRYSSLVLRVALPPDFPDKYRAGLLRAIDLCAVKRHLLEPPQIAIQLE